MFWPSSVLACLHGRDLACRADTSEGSRQLPRYANGAGQLLAMSEDDGLYPVCRVDGEVRLLREAGGRLRHLAIGGRCRRTMAEAMGHLPGNMGHHPGSGEDPHRKVG